MILNKIIENKIIESIKKYGMIMKKKLIIYS